MADTIAFLVLPLMARLAMPVQLDFDIYVRKIVVLRLPNAIAYGVDFLAPNCMQTNQNFSAPGGWHC